MNDTAATAQVIIRPPLAWALAVIAAFALDWLMPLPFVPGMLPAGWLGATVFALALVLVAWAIATMTRTGSNVPTSLPTTTIRCCDALCGGTAGRSGQPSPSPICGTFRRFLLSRQELTFFPSLIFSDDGGEQRRRRRLMAAPAA